MIGDSPTGYILYYLSDLLSFVSHPYRTPVSNLVDLRSVLQALFFRWLPGLRVTRRWKPSVVPYIFISNLHGAAFGWSRQVRGPFQFLEICFCDVKWLLEDNLNRNSNFRLFQSHSLRALLLFNCPIRTPTYWSEIDSFLSLLWIHTVSVVFIIPILVSVTGNRKGSFSIQPPSKSALNK